MSKFLPAVISHRLWAIVCVCMTVCSYCSGKDCVLSSLFGLLSLLPLLSCCWWLSLLLSLALAVRSCLVSLVAFMVPVFVSGCVRCVGACGCVS